MESRRFLGSDARGQDRLDSIPKEAHEILSTPRVLSYLRNLPDADLKRVRTSGDVYWHRLAPVYAKARMSVNPRRNCLAARNRRCCVNSLRERYSQRTIPTKRG